MSLQPKPVKQVTWMPLPKGGYENVEVKMLMGLEGELRVSMMKIKPNGGMPTHQDKAEIEVICLEGSGFVSVGEDKIPFKMGDRVTWPPNTDHRLWTSDDEMITLMIEKRYATTGPGKAEA